MLAFAATAKVEEEWVEDETEKKKNVQIIISSCVSVKYEMKLKKIKTKKKKNVIKKYEKESNEPTE